MGEKQEGRTAEEHQGTFGDDELFGHTHNLECGHGFIGIYMSKLNYKL